MRNPRITPKERGLIKGALRRVFSRSELRSLAITLTRVQHEDPSRPRVKKWSYCGLCGVVTPTYLMEVDHVFSVIPVDRTLADMSCDELVDRIWCDPANLMPVCKPCHKEKSRLENKERRRKVK